MENLREVLGNLKKGLDILRGNYTQWYQNSANGRHCSLGAIAVAKGNLYSSTSALEVLALSETAKALYPELKNCYASRLGGGYDLFDTCPILYINNHLGKEESLRMWELTIAELELRLAAQDPVPETVLDTVRV